MNGSRVAHAQCILIMCFGYALTLSGMQLPQALPLFNMLCESAKEQNIWAKWNQLSIHAARWILLYFPTSLLPLLLALPLSLSLSAPVQLRHLTIWNCTKYNLYNSERRTIIMLSKRIISTRLPIIIAQPCVPSPPLPILVMMQSSSGTVIMLPSVNPWAPNRSPQSESAARTHRDTFTVGVGVELELESRSVPLPVINAFLAGAAATLLPKNYALLNIVYEYTYICYGCALLVSYFTYNFVWFWFCTIYTTLDWDPRATDTRGSTRGSLGPRLGSLSLTVFSGGSLWSFVSS